MVGAAPPLWDLDTRHRPGWCPHAGLVQTKGDITGTHNDSQSNVIDSFVLRGRGLFKGTKAENNPDLIGS